MNAIKKTIAALAVGATAIVPLATSAQAHDRNHRHFHNHNHGQAFHCHRGNNFCQPIQKHVYRHRSDNGANVAGAAVLGIIGGALIGSAIANSNKQPRYVAPRTTYRTQPVYPPAPRVHQRRVATHAGTLEPWTRGWYQYCDAKYRSFNPEKGTYRGYDGYDHFCVAR